MHPRNIYTRPPDFVQLARRYPPLREHVFLTHTGPSIDFKSLVAQRRLTEALLYLDFHITLTLPDDRLCPPVPNRLNYVLWIQDLVRATIPNSEIVRGIDIGTGASAIYPLLACRLEPTWQFIATDIDKDSLVSAQQNVERNGLSDRVLIVQVPSNDPILHLIEGHPSTTYNFTMCNPPFYSSAEEVAQSAEAKEYGPNAICTGAESEMITPGGEVAFVSRLFLESIGHKTRCRWYTTMLGKMSSLPEIVGLLRQHQVENYAITEFVQGQTRRWAIGWSFETLRLPDALARIANPTLQGIMPARTTLHQQFSGLESRDVLCDAVHRVLKDIEGVTLTSSAGDESNPSILVHATDITWTRSARRKKGTKTSALNTGTAGPILRCCITCSHSSTSDRTRSQGFQLEYQWVDGRERHVFESFVSHVNRKVNAVLGGS
ncbi:hypothetical protein F5I97DRAFT_1911874 [Phlebopus sp. FC_14]|nr:hypothetical protein F5I97DRAFT_1911874 [Phlebopus sp. FC_14]